MATHTRTAASWKHGNPVLNQGDVGIESDTGRQKIGDGVTPWTPLNYVDVDDHVIDGGAP